ncbi:hypothetical protein M3936_14120 [Sutcliffiella horikoshii]|uniref:hypothetical protein n=1 Tax=Sutcliffiella horikoshii TaxID=79883 RepID=UPI00203C4EF1|nr:hypothetical protein [Sutcliffiella horikoshii]MCM3618723.1 hypothetical protein [Sutcliffiella horikoshii]
MGKESKVLKNKTNIHFTVQVGKLAVTGGDRTRGAFFLSSNPNERAHRFNLENDARYYADQLKGTVLKHTIHEIQTEEIEEVTINEQPTISN